MSGWIGVDLDGTLAEYHGWAASGGRIGPPVPAMLERVKRWLAEGRDVRIFTARISASDLGPEESAKVIAEVGDWCQQHIGQRLPITNVKDFGMVELWDDRCVQVEANTGRALGCSTRGLE